VVNGQIFNEMDFFAQVEEEQKQQEQIKEMERLELLKNLPRWESKPHQILRSNLKRKPKVLKYYEKLEDLRQDGDFEQLCISLKSYVNELSSFLYKGLKGYRFTYAECQSEVWLVVAEMIDEYDNETDIPFVYRLKHIVYHNRYQNIIEYVKAQCRRLDYTHKIQSIEHLKELGKDIPDRKVHLYFEAVEDKID
jgi:hypothetical protein